FAVMLIGCDSLAMTDVGADGGVEVADADHVSADGDSTGVDLAEQLDASRNDTNDARNDADDGHDPCPELDAEPPAVPSEYCQHYCKLMEANCADYEIYDTEAECLDSCGVTMDTGVDCRVEPTEERCG